MVRAELLWAGAELWTLEMHVCDVRVGERARLCGRSGRTGVSNIPLYIHTTSLSIYLLIST